MQKINCTTVNGSVTGATPAAVVIPEYQKSKAVVRRFSAVGNDAGSLVKWYLPRAAFKFAMLEALASNGTALKVPVDAAGGHVFRGYTLTTGSKILLQTAAGWAFVAVSAVADVADKMYCTLTIGAPGAAIVANTGAYVVRPADLIHGLPAIGQAAVTVEDFVSGDPGAPVVFTIESASGKTTIAAALVEYYG